MDDYRLQLIPVNLVVDLTKKVTNQESKSQEEGKSEAKRAP